MKASSDLILLLCAAPSPALRRLELICIHQGLKIVGCRPVAPQPRCSLLSGGGRKGRKTQKFCGRAELHPSVSQWLDLTSHRAFPALRIPVPKGGLQEGWNGTFHRGM